MVATAAPHLSQPTTSNVTDATRTQTHPLARFFEPALSALSSVPMERAVFMREMDNRMYRINAYYASKIFR